MLNRSRFAGLVAIEHKDDFFQVFERYNSLKVFIRQPVGAIQGQQFVLDRQLMLLQNGYGIDDALHQDQPGSRCLRVAWIQAFPAC